MASTLDRQDVGVKSWPARRVVEGSWHRQRCGPVPAAAGAARTNPDHRL
jgi:hypothetical protein